MSGYPEGYRDPEWSTEKDFAEQVIPARAEALAQQLTADLYAAYDLPEGLRFEWKAL